MMMLPLSEGHRGRQLCVEITCNSSSSSSSSSSSPVYLVTGLAKRKMASSWYDFLNQIR